MSTHTNKYIVYICIALVLCACKSKVTQKKSGLNIVTTTVPIHQIVRNVVKGADSISVELLIPGDQGCPHDYVLTPANMVALQNADVLIINGSGLEQFITSSIVPRFPRLTIINSSQGIPDLISTESHHQHAHEHSHDASVNPHLFVSPYMRGLMVKTIVGQLSKFDTTHAKQFSANGTILNVRYQKIRASFENVVQRLSNKKVIAQKSVFDYLLRDLGIVAIETIDAHGHRNPTSSEMIALIQAAQNQKPVALIVEDDFPEDILNTFSSEVSMPVIKWQSNTKYGTSGNTSFEQVLLQNQNQLLTLINNENSDE